MLGQEWASIEASLTHVNKNKPQFHCLLDSVDKSILPSRAGGPDWKLQLVAYTEKIQLTVGYFPGVNMQSGSTKKRSGAGW